MGFVGLRTFEVGVCSLVMFWHFCILHSKNRSSIRKIMLGWQVWSSTVLTERDFHLKSINVSFFTWRNSSSWPYVCTYESSTYGSGGQWAKTMTKNEFIYIPVVAKSFLYMDAPNMVFGKEGRTTYIVRSTHKFRRVAHFNESDV